MTGGRCAAAGPRSGQRPPRDQQASTTLHDHAVAAPSSGCTTDHQSDAAALGCSVYELEVLVTSGATPHRADLERRSVGVADEGHDEAIGHVLVDPVATIDDVDRPPDLVAAARRSDPALLEPESAARYVTGGRDAQWERDPRGAQRNTRPELPAEGGRTSQSWPALNAGVLPTSRVPGRTCATGTATEISSGVDWCETAPPQ